jgi:hypothetical protein
MKVTNATRDQVAVTKEKCTTTQTQQHRLLAQGIIGILVTVLASGDEGAVEPADIVLTKAPFEVIGQEVVAVIYESEAVDVIPTITIAGASAETQVPLCCAVLQLCLYSLCFVSLILCYCLFHIVLNSSIKRAVATM